MFPQVVAIGSIMKEEVKSTPYHVIGLRRGITRECKPAYMGVRSFST